MSLLKKVNFLTVMFKDMNEERDDFSRSSVIDFAAPIRLLVYARYRWFSAHPLIRIAVAFTVEIAKSVTFCSDTRTCRRRLTDRRPAIFT